MDPVKFSELEVKSYVRVYDTNVHGYDYQLNVERLADSVVTACAKWIVDNAGAMDTLGPEYFAKAMMKDFGVN